MSEEKQPSLKLTDLGAAPATVCGPAGCSLAYHQAETKENKKWLPNFVAAIFRNENNKKAPPKRCYLKRVTRIELAT